MPQKLITPERIHAGTNMIRWNGWMKTPVDIITHSVVMAQTILDLTDDKLLARCALLHDLHETEIVGDVPTPDKHRYMNAQYFAAVDRFDAMLAHEAGVPTMIDVEGTKFAWNHHPTLRTADRAALLVENTHYVTRPDPKYPLYDCNAVWQKVTFDNYKIRLGSRTESFDIWYRYMEYTSA